MQSILYQILMWFITLEIFSKIVLHALLEPGTYPRCGSDFINQQTGTFESPFYPAPYKPESHCTWNITMEQGRYIQVTFKNVNLPGKRLIHDRKNQFIEP